MKKMLDLFSGLGGASQAMREDDDWEVTTVDFEERFNPDICEDVLNLEPEDFEENYDLIWASPPCTYFTIARIWDYWTKGPDGENSVPNHKKISDHVKLVFHTIWLINKLSPRWWIVENPRAMLRKILPFPPACTVDYCAYGSTWKKPTDFFGEIPNSFEPKRCNHEEAHGRMGKQTNEDASKNKGDKIRDLTRDPSKRARVPYELSRSIKESVENPKPKNGLEAFM